MANPPTNAGTEPMVISSRDPVLEEFPSGKIGWYVVTRGRVMGLHPDWGVTEYVTSGFRGQYQESFATRELALHFWHGKLREGAWGSPLINEGRSLEPFEGLLVSRFDDPIANRARENAVPLSQYLGNRTSVAVNSPVISPVSSEGVTTAVSSEPSEIVVHVAGRVKPLGFGSRSPVAGSQNEPLKHRSSAVAGQRQLGGMDVHAPPFRPKIDIARGETFDLADPMSRLKIDPVRADKGKGREYPLKNMVMDTVGSGASRSSSKGAGPSVAPLVSSILRNPGVGSTPENSEAGRAGERVNLQQLSGIHSQSAGDWWIVAKGKVPGGNDLAVVLVLAKHRWRVVPASVVLVEFLLRLLLVVRLCVTSGSNDWNTLGGCIAVWTEYGSDTDEGVKGSFAGEAELDQ
ncbi:hypothetical protein D9611_012429 [Ephemerocybe angulata]|uniref:Ribonuclease H1 N-terminal domain-containing protein n=1 Tax=Ephemerocybe angulata TaxID=980116 RepID=A0A8H5FKD7_9AGAR|nr:hypothetical protein D9611_012429 [Tulosesus angulatus]